MGLFGVRTKRAAKVGPHTISHSFLKPSTIYYMLGTIDYTLKQLYAVCYALDVIPIVRYTDHQAHLKISALRGGDLTSALRAPLGFQKKNALLSCGAPSSPQSVLFLNFGPQSSQFPGPQKSANQLLVGLSWAGLGPCFPNSGGPSICMLGALGSETHSAKPYCVFQLRNSN